MTEPKRRVVVSDEALFRVIGQPKRPSPNGNAEWGGSGEQDSAEWLRQWVADYCRGVAEKHKPEYELLWTFAECPFNSEHNRNEAAIGKKLGGGYFFRCPHDGCKGRGWKALRDHLTPGWDVVRNGGFVGSVGFVADPENENWDEPTEFRQFSRPPFPTHALPPWLEDFTLALAEETQTPPDLPALLSLAACAAALARKVVVRPRGRWDEPLNLYIVVALRPANRKSTVFKAVAAPIVAYEQWRVVEERPAVAAAQQRRDNLDARRKRAAAQEAKDGPPPMGITSESERLAQELAALEVPILPKLVADDVTPEKLANLLFEQGGRMAILSAEGGIFGIMAGRYSQGITNFEVFLKGHSGDELRVDRIGRPPEYVSEPALTIGVAVQPVVIRAVPREFKERGMMGRCLYSFPRSSIGRRHEDPPPMPQAVADEYYRQLTTLLELPAGERAYSLQFEPEGLARLLALAKAIEPRIDEATGDLAYMDDWVGKMVGAVARIAGILHCARNSTSLAPWEHPIEWETAEQAVVIGEYLLAHAQAAYGEMGADPALENAKRMLEWIDRHGGATFSRREMHRDFLGGHGQVDELTPGLDILVAHGYIRPERVVSPGLNGGRPSQIFKVHPLRQNRQNRQNPPEG